MIKRREVKRLSLMKLAPQRSYGIRNVWEKDMVDIMSVFEREFDQVEIEENKDERKHLYSLVEPIARTSERRKEYETDHKEDMLLYEEW